MTLQRHYLLLWKIYASGDIGGKDDIRNWGMNNDDWVKLCDIDFVKRYNNPSNNSKFSNIVEIKKEIPESLISLSSEYLIKNESDIDTLIFYLQEKFQMSKEKLEQWRAKIAFELRDNHNYWKKEHESMDEIAFLEYKRNFETKMGVPTTPHKKELKNKYLAIIEYT